MSFDVASNRASVGVRPKLKRVDDIAAFIDAKMHSSFVTCGKDSCRQTSPLWFL